MTYFEYPRRITQEQLVGTVKCMFPIALEFGVIGPYNCNDEAPSMTVPVLTKFNNLSIRHKWKEQQVPSFSRGYSLWNAGV
jgi:hypothetical protein